MLVRYGLASVVLFLALGSLLGHLLQGAIEDRVLDSALREAEVVTRLGVQSRLTPEEVRHGLTPSRLAALGHAFTARLSVTDVIDVTVWDLDGRVVFATDPEHVGAHAEPSPLLRRALAGSPLATITDSSGSPDLVRRRHGEILEAYTPLQFGSGPNVAVDGAVGLALPFRPIAETIRADTHRLYVALAVALAVLWGVLFRSVASASRRLREQSAVNQYQALHDGLTGLPNRSLFTDRLELSVKVAERVGVGFTVMLMDLDRFKEINDTLGHHHGDVVLQQVARRLTSTLRAGDTVARLGGDEFAFLFPEVDDEADALAVAAKIRATLEQPFDVLGLSLDVAASLGIAIYPDHAGTPVELVQRADIAMYEAKRQHSGQRVYAPDGDDHSRERLALTGELRRAIENGELVVHYQPQLDIASGRIIDAEALVRWDHPVHGLLGPGVFIPAAERSELIGPLTEHVLDVALRDCRRWNDRGHRVGVSVNLSARNLHSADLVTTVAALLDRHGVAPELLTLEITETMISADPHRAREAVLGLRALGIELSIDDFGTGYSSFAVLRSLPVTELKIDRSFVADLCSSATARTIVELTCLLGHRLGLSVVAEGVEDAETAAALSAIGCDLAQGYWYARPLELDGFLAYLADGPDGAVRFSAGMSSGMTPSR